MDLKTISTRRGAACLLVAGISFAGAIEGVVNFSGLDPKPQKLNRKSAPICAKKDFDDETILTSKDGKTLQNVLVRVTGNVSGGKTPTGDVMVDQRDCMYRPRVQGAVEGQKIMLRNNDGTLHNVHSYDRTKTLFNQAQPPKSPPIEKPIPKTTNVVKLKCDVHPWMTGFVVVSKNPYFAVSEANGKFEIKDVPAGTYTVVAWHETPTTKTEQVPT